LLSFALNPAIVSGLLWIPLISELSTLSATSSMRGYTYFIYGLTATFWGPFEICQFYLIDGVCLHRMETTILAFVVTATYCITAFARHNHVFSRTLGGPGIEKMEFLIRGVGPGYRRAGPYGDVQLS
jgi:hypothetical protein